MPVFALLRVAVVQFAVTDDVAANLRTCLRLIDQAAATCHPAVMVLPEFINHIAWYDSPDHCYAVAVSRGDAFWSALAERAAAHHCYLKVNVTLKQPGGQVTGTNVLFGPTGAVVAENDKQILMGNENNFLTPASQVTPLAETDFGALGMYACMDGVIPEVARALAVRHPLVLLNSLNSFAHDEAALHIPVRAAENKVFVAAANKVGALVPPHLTEAVAARLKIAPTFLQGAGESQIVAPDGRVLAQAPRTGEAVVWADLDLDEARHKRRPDGTDILLSRRPELYAPLGQAAPVSGQRPGEAEVLGAVYQPPSATPLTPADMATVVRQAHDRGVRVLVFPELAHLPHGQVTDPASAAALSEQVVAAVQAALAADHYAVLSVVRGQPGAWQHAGLVLSQHGVTLSQPQLHAAGRHPWVNVYGDALAHVDTTWGRLAVVVGNDAIYPETFRLAALQGVEVVGVPTTVLEPWESALGFPERAAENRLNVLVADRAESAIYAVGEDFTLWTAWKNRPFDGNINVPLITRGQTGLTAAPLYPAAAHNKLISHRTHLLDNRPWPLAAPLLAPVSAG